ncbi:hypothetical protein PBI_CORAL_57 [Arthrobacter phage Coral]|uniref:Uncharacterized protein n=2 Tax=Coralvirus coral TaxID=2734227 RepID=A0A3G2KHL1_9CAUD|nr:hypothetical protein HOU54_gp57 [Arthrobacter phage Coral]AYN57532.1 hypothetical protein PBI_CORAL_57 [Arthrobacter phage Coral]AYN58463.1 hypothetical protein PBI_LUNAR_59 [Arthrobacter phage Lunar]
MTTTTNEPDEIVYLGVYCDKCGATATGDFKVRASDSSETRLGYVRAWAAGQGWEIRPGLDLCGDCSKYGADMRELLEAVEVVGRHMRAGEYLSASAALADLEALVKRGLA